MPILYAYMHDSKVCGFFTVIDVLRFIVAQSGNWEQARNRVV